MYTQTDISVWLASHQDPLTPPLILAARQGRADVVDYLLQNRADLTALDQYGNNALWAACYSDAVDCIQRLLQAGIDVDYQNPSGASALIYAASSGKQVVVERLLQAGANPLLTTQDEFSALDLAANRQCLQLLSRAIKAWLHHKAPGERYS